MDIQSLIDLVLSDEKLNKSKSFQGVYRDKPILRPASRMDNYMPPQYAEMKKIAGDTSIFNRPMEIFYRQAKLMEDFEDTYDYRGSFFRYFPTYQAMTDGQLRGYFDWRTRVRRGEWPQTSLSFVYVYIYELLNQIGVANPAEGFEKLQALWQHYKGDSSLDRNMEMWLTDYAVYYGLPMEKLEGVNNRDLENALALLRNENTEDGPMFEALCLLSSYDIQKSRFYKQYPEDTAAVCCRVFRDLSEYYKKNRRQTLCDKYFGPVAKSRYHMFVSAVFAPRQPHPDGEYTVGPLTKYVCRGGEWWREGFYGKAGKSHDLGIMMKSVDYVMRQSQNYPYPLRSAEHPHYLHEQIKTVVTEYYEEKRRAERPEIKVDLSKLTGIRLAAATTRESLLTEEERDDLAEEMPVLPSPAENAVPETPAVCDEKAAEGDGTETAPACDLPLNETEQALLIALLTGKPFGDLLRRAGQMLSVVTDSINEKLFDEFYDTVLEFDNETPVIVEDYREELARRLLP